MTGWNRSTGSGTAVDFLPAVNRRRSVGRFRPRLVARIGRLGRRGPVDPVRRFRLTITAAERALRERDPDPGVVERRLHLADHRPLGEPLLAGARVTDPVAEFASGMPTRTAGVDRVGRGSRDYATRSAGSNASSSRSSSHSRSSTSWADAASNSCSLFSGVTSVGSPNAPFAELSIES